MNRLAKLRRWLRWRSYDNFLADLTPAPDPRIDALVKEREIAFVHIPKTGGLSLGTAIYGEPIGHRRWDELRQIDPVGFERWLKLAVVREPVDRFLSAYDYLATGGITECDRHFASRFIRGGAGSFAARLLEPGFRAAVTRYWHFRPQTDFIVSGDGLIMLNRLLPYDELDRAIAPLRLAPLPRYNVTPGKRSSRADLTAPGLRAIATIYAADFVLYRLAKSGAAHYRMRLPAA